MNSFRLRVVIACSSGGHFTQVKRLATVYEKYDHAYFTFRGGVADELAKTQTVISVPNIHRRNPFSLLRNSFYSIKEVIKSRPDVIITTGAGVVVPFCVISKLLGTKLIYIESMARIHSPTITARILYPFADLFIVQWPNLLEYFPKAKYIGRLL